MCVCKNAQTLFKIHICLLNNSINDIENKTDAKPLNNRIYVTQCNATSNSKPVVFSLHFCIMNILGTFFFFLIFTLICDS